VAARRTKEKPELSATANAVLGLLAFGRELSGYDLKNWADHSLRFFYWSPASSHIYGELRRLERLGYVSSRAARQDDLRNKRMYRITPQGRETLRDWLRTEPGPTVLKHNAMLRVWLGHLADPDDLRAVVGQHRASVEGLLAEARFTDEHATDDSRWEYPALVIRWSVGYLERELELIDEMLAGLDRVERTRGGRRLSSKASAGAAPSRGKARGSASQARRASHRATGAR
jgi:DNA-binding PadR family transcriptional regulator